ncbi:flagellar hook-length control protein FliK [Paenibacillus jilunlii]|uniref:Flagellar hook-length control protein FliK n=1 Tax=Paenibacillus jilunlii TaxID=682956 RepID=A0A1G9N844_9BACL|nr:flagellar hook-length control protein FliK [Paenibacillus jilunlii]SDL82699.1 flagellar hook-length control protein FliK [Paenibacillus jilunlii]
MSLVLQSMSGGNKTAVTGTSTSASAGTAAGTASAAPFAQTLVQSMGAVQATETAAPAVLGNLASLLQGLMNAVQAAGEDTGTGDTAKSAELLQGLTEDVEKLDEDISSEPALIAALQGWLLQVSALLSGSAPTEGTAEAGSASAETLSPLAQNPETLRFAVQDELNSLVSLIQQAAAEGNEQTSSAGITLLNNFTAILADTLVPDNKAKAKPAASTDATPVVLKPVSETDSNVDVKAKTPVHTDIRTSPATAAPAENRAAVPTATVTADDSADLIAAPQAKAALPTDASENGAETEVLAGAKPSEESHEVVTAGQLSLRGGITAPLKAETPPVPVHQFANEMTSFITGKLEIVKKGGVAEATITLFPENLGQVDVKITMQNGHLVAQFLTEHAGAKDMLEQQMSQLRSALQHQGLQVEKLEVTQNNTPLQSQYNGSQQGRGAGSGSQQQERRSKERTEEISDAVLAAELNGEWKEWVAGTQQDNRSQGGSFSAKA